MPFSCDFAEPLPFNIESKNLFNGFSLSNNTLQLDLVLSNAIKDGIIIPGDGQEQKWFSFSTVITGKPGEKIYYKIFYQNKSYKYEETNELSNENFYGSWEDADLIKSILIPASGSYTITDSFRIVGNPRNEDIYLGGHKLSILEKSKVVKDFELEIRSSETWYQSIQEKARNSGRRVDEQLYMDAVFMANTKEEEGKENNRWKRNPRMGEYEFALFTCTEKGLHEVDTSAIQISKTNTQNSFTNPFTYFSSKVNTGTWSWEMFDEKLIVRATLDGSGGIYVDRFKYPSDNYNSSCYSSRCGDNEDVFQHALFEQYFHMLYKDKIFNNVDAVADVMNENISSAGIDAYATWPDEKRIKDHFHITDCPCKTVKSADEGQILLTNPGNSKPDQLRKEQVGIQSRIGFTYGKFTAKIKFPELLNSNGVWNGITNAFWLLYQSEGKWNTRRVCADAGYIPKHVENDASVRVPQLNYSEIDFEIIKTSQYWPSTSYGGIADYPREDASKNQDIIVSCTNWDMACREPKIDVKGVVPFAMNGTSFQVHRWDDWHQAITLRSPQNEDELFQTEFYYFEIEWKPGVIHWRIGPSKDKMKLICSMSDEITSVPNNQMIMVITQEFHYAEWWPPIVYSQENIPFPSKDITGIVYEVEIE